MAIYATLEEANAETMTRFDGYGFEILSESVIDAVNYLIETKERHDLPP